MLNFAVQTSRAAVKLGRLHHAVSTGAVGLACSANSYPLISATQGHGNRHSSHVSCSSCSTQCLHQHQRVPLRNPIQLNLLSSPLLKHGCRVPCLPLERCASQTCQRTFGTSGLMNALTKSTSILPEEKPGIMVRVLDSVGLAGKLRFNRFKMRVAGLKMYEACADGYDFETFFRACNMPDTLFSWFLVMELHVWMCMVRLKQEGREGKYLTHYLILSMWHDVQARGKLMGISAVKMKESLTKMVEQFNGALFAYDEGLLSNDKVLAAALWRNLFLKNCDDPERLANMVEYVRQQVQYLDSLDSRKLMMIGRIKWQPYKGGVPDSDTPLPKAATIDDELNVPEVDKVSV